MGVTFDLYPLFFCRLYADRTTHRLKFISLLRTYWPRHRENANISHKIIRNAIISRIITILLRSTMMLNFYAIVSAANLHIYCLSHNGQKIFLRHFDYAIITLLWRRNIYVWRYAKCTPISCSRVSWLCQIDRNVLFYFVLL